MDLSHWLVGPGDLSHRRPDYVWDSYLRIRWHRGHDDPLVESAVEHAETARDSDRRDELVRQTVPST